MAKATCPESPKATHGGGTGAHNWRLAGPWRGNGAVATDFIGYPLRRDV